MSAPSAFKFSFTTVGTDSKSVAFTSVLSGLFTPGVPQPSGQVLPQFPFTAVGTDSKGVPFTSIFPTLLLLFQEVFHRVLLQAELEPVLLVGFQSLLLLRLTLQLARRSRSASIQPWQQSNTGRNPTTCSPFPECLLSVVPTTVQNVINPICSPTPFLECLGITGKPTCTNSQIA
jgi:hypothetical protein